VPSNPNSEQVLSSSTAVNHATVPACCKTYIQACSPFLALWQLLARCLIPHYYRLAYGLRGVLVAAILTRRQTRASVFIRIHGVPSVTLSL
jgi:hypothetical protein